MATDDSRPKSLPVNVLRGVAWKTYQQLRDHPSNGHLRMSSLDGTLTLMSPEFIHDRYGRRLSIVIDQVTEAWQVLVQGTATTTLRRKGEGRRKGSAKEPDYGFYYGENALRMNNRAELDLDVDPPPDLVIEGDYKSDTAKALKLYSRLGIPEVWRYQPKDDKLLVRPVVGGFLRHDRAKSQPPAIDSELGPHRPGENRRVERDPRQTLAPRLGTGSARSRALIPARNDD